MTSISGSARRLPDFYLIGAPKCGTTSLFSWLSAHPSLFMPSKEPGYYSRDIYPVPINTLTKYEKLYENVGSNNILIGEASPKYMYSDSGLQELALRSPNAKLIVMLRNPVDLVVSMHGQMLKEGREARIDFEEAWRQLPSRSKAIGPLDTRSIPIVLDYPFWGQIGTRLQTVAKYFPLEQIQVFKLDDLSTSPRVVYAKVLEFLGVANDGRSNFPTFNARLSIDNLWIHRIALTLRRRTQFILDPVRNLRGGKGFGILQHLNRLNVKSDSALVTIDTRFRSELVDHFSDELSKIEEMTGWDVSTWNA